MRQRLEEELESWNRQIKLLAASGYRVREFCKDAVVIEKERASTLPAGKTVGLTLMGITHGNEVAGLAALNDILSYLINSQPSLSFPLALALGNRPAYLENKRFLDRDLNRSFQRKEANAREDQRARELEPLLQTTAYFLDLHQTIEASESPFFIFPFTESGFEWARDIDARLPVVTHWGKPFSEDGCCTDEYVNACGGVGITVELGQNGFAPQMVAAGFRVALGALSSVAARLRQQTFNRTSLPEEIYTWAQTIPFPEDGIGLKPGYKNFQQVQKGERLGGSDSRPIIAAASGKILFPKYVREQSVKPKELCRIIKPVAREDIGKEST